MIHQMASDGDANVVVLYATGAIPGMCTLTSEVLAPFLRASSAEREECLTGGGDLVLARIAAGRNDQQADDQREGTGLLSEVANGDFKLTATPGSVVVDVQADVFDADDDVAASWCRRAGRAREDVEYLMMVVVYLCIDVYKAKMPQECDAFVERLRSERPRLRGVAQRVRTVPGCLWLRDQQWTANVRHPLMCVSVLRMPEYCTIPAGNQFAGAMFDELSTVSRHAYPSLSYGNGFFFLHGGRFMLASFASDSDEYILGSIVTALSAVGFKEDPGEKGVMWTPENRPGYFILVTWNASLHKLLRRWTLQRMRNDQRKMARDVQVVADIRVVRPDALRLVFGPDVPMPSKSIPGTSSLNMVLRRVAGTPPLDLAATRTTQTLLDAFKIQHSSLTTGLGELLERHRRRCLPGVSYKRLVLRYLRKLFGCPCRCFATADNFNRAIASATETGTQRWKSGRVVSVDEDAVADVYRNADDVGAAEEFMTSVLGPIPEACTRFYHATDATAALGIVRHGPLPGEPLCDFGRAFYMTKSATYAWAYALDAIDDEAVVVAFDVCDSWLSAAETCELQDTEWANVVVAALCAGGVERLLAENTSVSGAIASNHDEIICGASSKGPTEPPKASTRFHQFALRADTSGRRLAPFALFMRESSIAVVRIEQDR